MDMGVVYRTSGNSATCAYLNIITNYQSPKLLNLFIATFGRCKTKTISTKRNVWMDNAISANVYILNDWCVCMNNSFWSYATFITNKYIRSYKNIVAYYTILTYVSIIWNNRALSNWWWIIYEAFSLAERLCLIFK